jgi:NAD(P)-dependent dehydrogenase (short-subunit alcohol dehydrogenase family)
MKSLQEEMTGKVVVITGGNRGIGSGCARAFCECGATVVISARDRERGQALAGELSDMTPGTCVFFQCDVSLPEQVADLVATTADRYGRLDCMINNAGYLPRRRFIEEISVDDFERVLRTNLLGIFSGCKYSLPHLRQSRGSIINMSSILGSTGQEGSSIYCASKAAITALTKSLAIDEAKNGVRINAILPGNIRSELGKEHRDEGSDGRKAELFSQQIQWIRRQGEPLDIGWTCVYLASDMAAYVTGAEIVVSGGFELGNGLRLTMEEYQAYNPETPSHPRD